MESFGAHLGQAMRLCGGHQWHLNVSSIEPLVFRRISPLSVQFRKLNVNEAARSSAYVRGTQMHFSRPGHAGRVKAFRNFLSTFVDRVYI